MPLFERNYADLYNSVSKLLGLKERIKQKKCGVVSKFVFVDEDGRELYESFFYSKTQIYADGYSRGKVRGFARRGDE